MERKTPLIIIDEKSTSAEITAKFTEILSFELIEKCAVRMISKAQDKQAWLDEFWGIISQKTAFSACRRNYEE